MLIDIYCGIATEYLPLRHEMNMCKQKSVLFYQSDNFTSESLKTSQIIIQNLLHNPPVRAEPCKEKHRSPLLPRHVLSKDPRVNTPEETLRAQFVAPRRPFFLCLGESLDNAVGVAFCVAVHIAI